MTLKGYNIYHKPVLLSESIDLLDINPSGVYVDCTLGGAGHSSEILRKLGKDGKLIGIDKDEDAIKESDKKLRSLHLPAEYKLVKDDFVNIKEILEKENIEKADGILADFGVSSHQLDENQRGFGYMRNGPLDMRMDRQNPLTAGDVVNAYSREKLEKIFKEYGEERCARRIAAAICRNREIKPFTETLELAEVIKKSMPPKGREEAQHPAKRTFQAIRIEVNNELQSISKLLDIFPEILNPGGVFVAISFHSLEDRLVKEAFRKHMNPCTCPRDFPICNCGKVSKGKILTTKPIMASFEEREFNPRARSAKLRAFKVV